ncbi:DUF5412 family protein [Bacillus horti]|uniref:Uncharacterized protein n=1 Tax=Caldalkalibacillus horti TaxID=77523 RepID=A0ABT9VX22_9BACI|nr:DUF5412 family protein [Bacillus horti]MDQ0165528.1 hypothetical protein [Bacillus horti]
MINWQNVFRIVLAVAIVIAIYIALWVYPVMENIEVDELELLRSMQSPNGAYTLDIYYRGGILLYADYTYVGQIRSNHVNATDRNLFLVGEDNSFRASWLKDDTVLLKAHDYEVELNVDEDSFDFRFDLP